MVYIKLFFVCCSLLILATLSNASTVFDRALSSSVGSWISKKEVLFISFRDVKINKTESRKVLLSMEFSHKNKLAFILQQSKAMFSIRTLIDGREKLQHIDLNQDSNIKSIMVEINQPSRLAKIFVNCQLLETVKMTKVPRDLIDKESKLRLHRNRYIDTSIDYTMGIFIKLGCDSSDQFQNDEEGNEIYTYRRGDIPVSHGDQKVSLLINTLGTLIETIQELQVEIQTQREETALLRDSIVNCLACKSGRPATHY